MNCDRRQRVLLGLPESPTRIVRTGTQGVYGERVFAWVPVNSFHHGIARFASCGPGRLGRAHEKENSSSRRSNARRRDHSGDQVSRRERRGPRMVRKRARRKTGTRGASRKRASRTRGRAGARAKRTVRRARPRKAAAKSRSQAKRPAKKRAAKRPAARPAPEPAASTVGQASMGGYTPQPMPPLEPMRHDPWDRPAEHHREDAGMEDEEEEEPL